MEFSISHKASPMGKPKINVFPHEDTFAKDKKFH